MEKYVWEYTDRESFDRSANSKLRNYLISLLGLQNVRGKTYSVKFHYDYVGADFYEDVYDLIKQTIFFFGIQEADLLEDQDNRYFWLNSGG